MTSLADASKDGAIASRGILTAIYKCMLVAAGMLLLLAVGGNFHTLLMVLGLATVSFTLAELAVRHASETSRGRLALLVVPGSFLAIVLLNMSGWIGTLTGSANVSEKLILFLAAPFYFLSISGYVSDVIAGKRSQVRYLDYLVYVTLPFKLLAGPLEPPGLLRQIELLRPRFSFVRVLAAWPWIVLGAFMKFAIANRLNPISNLSATDPISALLTATVFELKFYFDFAGYSFIAYGLALSTGLKISQNFNHPFFSPNVVVFWRRWHMSLGRFLSRYILEPNLRHLKGRRSKEIFAAGIFLVSAMWHGGTPNYLLWGIFHGLCYWIYIRFIKHKEVHLGLAILSMLVFFVLGRLLATDVDTLRLVAKISNILNPLAYFATVSYETDQSEMLAIALGGGFLVLEAVTLRRYGLHRPYHFFRKPFVALGMLVLLLLVAMPSGALLYARV